MCGCSGQQRSMPCLILNKRSAQVRQAGDLCCPGGSLSWSLDRFLSLLLPLSGTFRHYRGFYRSHLSGNRQSLKNLNLLLAAGLREAWEEMRLNPLRFHFLGLLPPQPLVMFKRVIYPIVGWATSPSYTPNWEVERIVPVSLASLLDPAHYGRFLPLVLPPDSDQRQPLRAVDFPCFIHQEEAGREMLWGATYRLTQDFLRMVFDFALPANTPLPLVERQLDAAYLNGSR